MLEGLEASEIRHSIQRKASRFDAEHFRKQFLREADEVSHHEVHPLGELAFITDGQHGYHEVDNSSPIHMLTARSARGWFADKADADRIAKWVDDANQRSSLEVNDLILSTRGTVGLCAVIDEEVLPANIDQDVARIAVTSKRVNSRYVLAYMNSRYGQDWMERNQTGMVQQGLPLAKVREMPIPLIGRQLQQKIASVVESARVQRDLSRNLYTQAETKLLSELGLSDWQPEDPLTYEAKSSDALAAGRLDAEYFRPMYDDLIKILRHAGSVELRTLLRTDLRRGISPEYSEQGDTIVVNSQHVGTRSIEIESNRMLESHRLLPAQSHALLQQYDVLLNSTGVNTIGRCQALLQRVSAVADNHVAIIRADMERIDPVFLGLFLNSLPGHLQSQRGWTGSSGQIELRPDVIASYLIWNAPWETQRAIRQTVIKSQMVQEDAESLIEKAKQAVEIAIEHGEEAAGQYLDGKAFVQSSALPAMTEKHRYFSLDALREFLATRKLTYQPETVNSYMSRMKREGEIFSAGRGWYSSIPEPYRLLQEPVADLVADLEVRFPMLEFACWSTGQLNPHLHHALGKVVRYVYVDRDAMMSVFDALQDTDYRVYLNPTRREAAKAFVVGERTLVIRPSIGRSPVEGKFARIEKILIDLHVELESIPLLSRDEFREAAQTILSESRLNLAKLINYAAQRKVNWREIFPDPDGVVAGARPS